MDLSFSIVLYFTELNDLKKCLEKLNPAKASEVFLVDNSNDTNYHQRLETLINEYQTQDTSLKFSLIRSPKNLGYGAGHNFAIQETQAHYHIVLNADVFVAPSALENAQTFMNTHPEVGLLSPAVRGEDGERHYLCRQNPTFFTQFLRSFSPDILKKPFQKRLDKLVYKDHNYDSVIYDVPFLTGCFMFFRTSVLKEIGGFDERYFLYMEDADITRKVLSVARTAYVPSVKVVHKWNRGIQSSWKHKWLAIESALRYFKKWRKSQAFD